MAISIPPDTAGTLPRRRRLWQLPAELRTLVVGLSLPPALLRPAAERALGQLHRVRVQLTGSDADLLASVLCDLGSRNALSEAVQRLLAQRHAVPAARLSAMRDPDTLRDAWRAALAGGDVPGTLWALLCHPQGETWQDALRVDAQAWLFAQMRAARLSEAAQRQAGHDAAAQGRELHELRLRLQSQQAAFDAERRRFGHQIAQLNGERQALQDAARAHPPLGPRGPAPEPTAPRRRLAPAAEGHDGVRAAAPVATPVAAPDTSPPPDLRGRRVLCVGGMPGAQSRYRELVETAGGRFDFHDGGLEQGLHRLDRQLGAADLVVCQAGCLNHEAYRRVKGHCRRATKTCLYVERPSLALFARRLGLGSQEARA